MVDEPEQTAWLAIAFTDGVGFTVMALTGMPPQPVEVGVTVMVAVIGAAVVLRHEAGYITTAAGCKADRCIGVSPVIGGARGNPLKVTAVVPAPLHTTWLAGWLTTAAGFTVR